MPVVAPTPTSRRIFRLLPDEIAAWLEERPDSCRRWTEDHGFSAKPGTHLAFPGDEGGIAEVVLGKKDAFVDGARAGNLPAGVYALADQDKPRNSPSVFFSSNTGLTSSGRRHRRQRLI